MTTRTSRSRRPGSLPGVVISLATGATFAVGVVLALGWDRESAVFPLVVSGLGLVLALASAARSWLVHPTTAETEPGHAAEEDVVEDPLDYVFGSATLREWATTLASFGGFFLLLYVAGLYLTALLFTVVYLKTQDGRSWIFSGAYAVILTAALYVVFETALRQPMPPGLFGLS